MAEPKIAKPVTDEIATVAVDMTRRFFGRTLTNDDDTLVTRGGAKGLRIYDEIKRDCHALAVLNKRKLAIIARPWDVEASSDSRRDKKAAALVKDMIDGLQFDRICLELLDATLKGFSVGEIMPERRPSPSVGIADAVMIADVKPRLAQRFVFDIDGNLRLLTMGDPTHGVELPARKFIVHRTGGTDSPYGLGLGSALFWPVFFKRQGVGFWLAMADKFGMPTAVGKYPAGTLKPEQDVLEEALRSIAQDYAIKIPEGMVIELLESTRAGTGDVYDRLVRYLDEQISEAVLGETMTTTSHASGLGSGQADVHNDVRKELAQADADLLSDTINSTLVKWVIDWNLPGAGYPKIYRNFEDPEDLDARADRDKKVQEMGFDPSEEYIRETYGDGWTRRVAPAGNALAGAQPGRLPSPGDAQFADPATDEQDGVDVQAQRLAEEAAQPLGVVISYLESMVNRAESLETLRDDLLGAYGHLPIDDLRRVMSQAFAAAQAGGRFDVIAE